MVFTTFDAVLLDFDLDVCVSRLAEWESASVTTTQNVLDSLSLEFWLNYFDHDASMSHGDVLVDLGIDLYPQYHTGGVWSNLLFQGAFDLTQDFGVFFELIDYRAFYDISIFHTTSFSDTAVFLLYSDFMSAVYDYYVSASYHGTSLTNNVINVRWMFELVYSADLFLIAVEILAVILVLGVLTKVTSLFSNTRVFYDDIVTFCQTNNISFTEVGTLLTFFLGFLVFDIFISASDEDITDVFSYFMFGFVVLLFFFLILGSDVQYYYMISSISNGDLTLRVICFDVINNFLCVLRIFFCWVRYIFYDLQVELVDFSFHYTDSVNDLGVLALYDNVSHGWFNDAYIATSASNLFSVFKTAGWFLIYMYVDISILIFQMLIGFAKFFIAFFLLWLIVDLFILKALAHSESNYIKHLRGGKS